MKPHTVQGIRAGLRELHRKRPKRGAEQRRYLITYHYPRRATRTRPFALTALVLEPERAVVSATPSGPRSRGAEPELAWLASLGRWYLLAEALDPPPRPLGEWARTVGSTVFGSMVEPYLRDAFVREFERSGRVRRHVTRRKSPSAAGPDVRWYELADFLQELSSELRRRPGA